MRGKWFAVIGALAVLAVASPQVFAADVCTATAVTTTSVSLLAAATAARSRLRICNAGPAAVYVCNGQGAANCTAAIGQEVGIGCMPDFDVKPNTAGASVPPPGGDWEAISLDISNVTVCVQ
jgi:hypothetical protein